MNRSLTLFGGAALAVAAMLSSTPAAYAQHHGGMSGGAYHGGGMGSYHGGGGNWGGYRGGYYGGGYGYRGYGYGYGYPGFGLYLGLGGLGYGGYGGYGYPGYYDYGYAPSYGYGGYAPNYYDYGSAYGYPQAAGVQTQSAYQPSGSVAHVAIRVPADAQVWVDDYQVNQSGPVREINTPPVLEPGKPYHYTVKAQWNDNGKPVVREQRVNVQAGQTSVADFTRLPATSPDQSPAPPVPPPAPSPPASTTPPAATPPATTPPVSPVRPG